MEKLCALSEAVGTPEECPAGWCAFWERGGAVIEPGCAIERLGLDLSNQELARHLLDLRHVLERARSDEEAELARRQLDALVPADLSGA